MVLAAFILASNEDFNDNAPSANLIPPVAGLPAYIYWHTKAVLFGFFECRQCS